MLATTKSNIYSQEKRRKKEKSSSQASLKHVISSSHLYRTTEYFCIVSCSHIKHLNIVVVRSKVFILTAKTEPCSKILTWSGTAEEHSSSTFPSR